MPLVRDVAVCLRVSPYSESSQIVTLFTREHGRLRLIAKGAVRRTKAGKSKFDGGLDLLDSGDAVFSHAPEKDLSLLTEWRLRDGHLALRNDLRATYLGLFAGEVIDRLIEEHDAHPKLFDQLERLLVRLPDTTVRESVFLAFLLNVLRQTGVLPDLARCVGGMPAEQADRVGFSPKLARLVCGDQVDETPDALDLPRPSLDALLSLLRLARTGGELPAVTREAAEPALRVLVVHIQEQTGQRLRLARYIVGNPASPSFGRGRAHH